MNRPILDVHQLSIQFSTPDGMVKAVNDVSFAIGSQRTTGVVGESGSGKSQIAFSLLGLLATNAIVSGRIFFKGRDLLQLSTAELNRIRTKEIAMIFQDPMTSLNPYLRIESQLTEVLIQHENLSYKEAYRRSLAMLDAVKIPAAASRMQLYPHEFSGGMRQRVMIAMALLCQPSLLVADEPTTALDVTVQAQILKLLHELQTEFHTSILLITHDLGVVAELCDEILVVYAGKIVEKAQANALFDEPLHPYTKALLHAIPKLGSRQQQALHAIPGSPPNLLYYPSGCPFQERCEVRFNTCRIPPRLREVHPAHECACHHFPFPPTQT